jgi:hypothetical protein
LHRGVQRVVGGIERVRHELLRNVVVVGKDVSCADHNIAYRTRHGLLLDYVPNGVAGSPKKDTIIFDVVPQGGGDVSPGTGQMPGVSASGFGHISCHGYNVGGNATSAGFAAELPDNR